MKCTSLIALAACAGSPATPIHNTVKATALTVGLPRAYAALFVNGARWKLGHVTCEIAGAKQLAGGWMTSLRCDGNAIASRVNRELAATTKGLWIVGAEFDGNFAALAPGDMVMAALPVDIMRPTIEDPTWPTGRLFELHPHHGAWCMSELGYGGDESAWQLCVSPAGVVGGWSQLPGGPEASFGDVRKADGT